MKQTPFTLGSIASCACHSGCLPKQALLSQAAFSFTALSHSHILLRKRQPSLCSLSHLFTGFLITSRTKISLINPSLSAQRIHNPSHRLLPTCLSLCATSEVLHTIATWHNQKPFLDSLQLPVRPTATVLSLSAVIPTTT